MFKWSIGRQGKENPRSENQREKTENRKSNGNNKNYSGLGGCTHEESNQHTNARATKPPLLIAHWPSLTIATHTGWPSASPRCYLPLAGEGRPVSQTKFDCTNDHGPLNKAKMPTHLLPPWQCPHGTGGC